MTIKQYNIEPTEENALQSLVRNTYGRNDSVKSFLELIDKAEAFPVFALNAEWGEGKTFFVLQAKMILEYLNPNCKQDEETENQLQKLLNLPNTAMEKPELTRKIFPIYYNAWLYDDHKDPLLSFIYFLSITFHKKYNRLDTGGFEKLSKAVELITSWKLGFSCNLEALKASLLGNDADKNIAHLEDAKALVEEAFCELLEENDSLLVFVDEIDRCNPKYAIEFLETIKHFFSCAKVQFVFSTNIKQLSETIRNVYGAGFDGTRYLNKFFNFTTELSPVDTRKIGQKNGLGPSRYFSNSFAASLISSMRFTIRETNIYLGQVPLILAKCQMAISNCWDYKEEGFAYTCYPVVLFALSLMDRKKYTDFLNGLGEETLLELVCRWDGWQSCATGCFFGDLKTIGDAELIEAIKADYRRIFGNVGGTESQSTRRSAEIKEEVLRFASMIG